MACASKVEKLEQRIITAKKIDCWFVHFFLSVFSIALVLLFLSIDFLIYHINLFDLHPHLLHLEIRFISTSITVRGFENFIFSSLPCLSHQNPHFHLVNLLSTPHHLQLLYAFLILSSYHLPY